MVAAVISSSTVRPEISGIQVIVINVALIPQTWQLNKRALNTTSSGTSTMTVCDCAEDRFTVDGL